MRLLSKKMMPYLGIGGDPVNMLPTKNSLWLEGVSRHHNEAEDFFGVDSHPFLFAKISSGRIMI